MWAPDAKKDRMSVEVLVSLLVVVVVVDVVVVVVVLEFLYL